MIFLFLKVRKNDLHTKERQENSLTYQVVIKLTTNWQIAYATAKQICKVKQITRENIKMQLINSLSQLSTLEPIIFEMTFKAWDFILLVPTVNMKIPTTLRCLTLIDLQYYNTSLGWAIMCLFLDVYTGLVLKL